MERLCHSLSPRSEDIFLVLKDESSASFRFLRVGTGEHQFHAVAGISCPHTLYLQIEDSADGPK